MKPVTEIHWVRPGLAVWGGYDPSCKVECCSTAVETGDGFLIVDPIPLIDAAAEELFVSSRPVAIYLTSGNHQRASLEWKKRWELPIIAPTAARGEVEADVWMGPGQRLIGHAGSLLLPGGAPGESAVQVGETLIFGDALIHLSGLELLPAKYCQDQKQLIQSLAALRTTQAQTLCFAHGLPIVAKTQERLNALFSEIGVPEI
jgi:hypothetical protein